MPRCSLLARGALEMRAPPERLLGSVDWLRRQVGGDDMEVESIVFVVNRFGHGSVGSSMRASVFSAARFSAPTDGVRALVIDHSGMVSYAVLWQSGDGEVHAGKIELDPYGFALTGMSGRSDGRRSVIDRVEFESIWTARLGREVGDRIVGQPALILDRAGGGPLRIASIDSPGTLRELAERLGKLIPTHLAL